MTATTSNASKTTARLEFSDAKTNYLSDETVTVGAAAGATLITVSCQGPWVLLKLPKGR